MRSNCLIAAAMLCIVANAQTNPVISIGNCSTLCATFPATVDVDCGKCLLTKIPSWLLPNYTFFASRVGSSCVNNAISWECINRALSMNVSVPSVELMQRLPLYESGYTSIPAVPFLFSGRFTNPAQNPQTLVFLSQLLSINYQFTPRNVTLCNVTNTNSSCITRPAGSDIFVNLAGGVICVQNQGWMTVPSSINTYYPACTGSLTLTNVTLEVPENLSVMVPSTRGRSVSLSNLQAEAKSLITDVDFAASSLFGFQFSFATSELYRNITAARAATLASMYGDKWNKTWDTLVAAGDLVELDLSWMINFNASTQAGRGPIFAPHTILQATGSKANLKFEVIAVLLKTSVDGFKTGNVYTKDQSPSAFIFAIMAVRSAWINHMIWGGHVYHFHLMQGAVIYALYNSINPGVAPGAAPHPVRQLLDQYLDPVFPQGFIASLFAAGNAPPPTPVNYQNLLTFWELYAADGPYGKNLSFYALNPKQQLNWSGLDSDRFSQSAGDWKYYEMASLHLQQLQATTAAATTVITSYYANDKAVLADKAVQQWAKSLVDPQGANLVRINANNRISTRDELAELCGYIMFTSVAHNMATMQDYLAPMLSQSRHPVALNVEQVPGPASTLSTTELTNMATTTDTYSKQVSFVYAFMGAATWTTFVPGTLNRTAGTGAPNYTASLPFFAEHVSHPGWRAPIDRSNSAIVRMRRQVSAIVKNFVGPTGGIRSTYTNWAFPMAPARVIEL